MRTGTMCLWGYFLVAEAAADENGVDPWKPECGQCSEVSPEERRLNFVSAGLELGYVEPEEVDELLADWPKAA